MSKQQKGTPAEDNFENVESALSKTEHFIEENQNKLSIIALAIIVIVGGYWGLKKFYFLPLENEAQAQVFYAQQYFEQDSFKLALNGDGINPGFEEIMDEFGSTKAGKLSGYYAGIAHLQMGDFEEAVSYLKGFSSSEININATATGALGDAYAELGETDKAMSQYKKAASIDNELTAPVYLMKLALMHETAGNYAEAVASYTVIKEKYKSSSEARQIDKYLTRAQLKQGK
ncbi:tetratricopeptide repeat protein [Carboxylicivirga sp. N1Y90]|uniref:tetratricopeptide repeat protein n=1 Tax=Carboxylicivirga fragile TaxID=3417571 RepID=UPI003D34DAF0|nr:tetratricopeptide repeat protein [Marinilabiliaceae bacterium N1Y90]